ncbi:hypothetical protein K1719_037394 [Acacia pycnantha]|nr:hypothetical protein K1719_037394 [Acacia pycnantha]
MNGDVLEMSKESSALVPSSVEDDDLLHRSSKKIKNGECMEITEEWPKLSKNGSKRWGAGMTFAEKLQGINQGDTGTVAGEEAQMHAEDILSDNIDNESDMEDIRPWEPQFQPWKATIDKMKQCKSESGVVNSAPNVVKTSEQEVSSRGDSAMADISSCEQDTWKVVKKFNRKKKFVGKEKMGDRAQSQGKGSRFGVLNMGEADAIVMDQSVEARVAVVVGQGDVTAAMGSVGAGEIRRGDSSVNNVREQKGMGKKYGKGKKVPRGKDKLYVGQLGLRNDKRSRDMGDNKGALSLALCNPVEMKDKDVQLVVHDSSGKEPVEEVKIDEGFCFNSEVVKGESSLELGLKGRFWADSSVLELDGDVACGSGLDGVMVLDSDSGGVLVQDSGLDCEMVQETGPEVLGGDIGLDSNIYRKHPNLLLLAETKCESVDRFKCLSILGFDGLVCAPSVGRSGGILAAWKKDQLDVSVVKLERQLIHLRCSGMGCRSFFLTAVYSIPDNAHKNILWHKIRNLALVMDEPWVLIGDFNDVASSSERTGGARPCVGRMNLFSDRVNRQDATYSKKPFKHFRNLCIVFNRRGSLDH